MAAKISSAPPCRQRRLTLERSSRREASRACRRPRPGRLWPLACLLVTPVLEQSHQLRLDVGVRWWLAKRARQIEHGLHLRQVGGARRARREVSFECGAVFCRERVTEVQVHELHDFLALVECFLAHDVSALSESLSSSSARAFARPRWSRTRW